MFTQSPIEGMPGLFALGTVAAWPIKPLALGAAVCLASALWLRLRRGSNRPAGLSMALGLLCLAVALLAPAGAVVTAVGERMLRHDEANVATLVVAGAHGQQLYHAREAAGRYSLLYGPAAFASYYPVVWLGARHVQALQLWVALAQVMALWLMALGLRRVLCQISWRGRGLAVMVLAGWFGAMVLSQWTMEWGIRTDAMLLLFSALGAWAAVCLGRGAAPWVVAVAGAALVDIKVTAVALGLVAVALVWERLGRRAGVQALLAMALLAVLPFALPNVSLGNYLYWLKAAAAHGLSARQLTLNGAFLLRMVLPLAGLGVMAFLYARAAGVALLRRHWATFVLGLGAAALALLSSVKHGSGAWQMVPLAPWLVLATAALIRLLVLDREQRARISASPWTLIAMALFALALANGAVTGLLAIAEQWPHAVAGIPQPWELDSDLDEVEARERGQVVAMGYGGNRLYELTWPRVDLELAGQPLWLDANAVAEMDLSGVAMPQATLQALRNCVVNVWLVPKGEEPFSLDSRYALEGVTREPLFSPDFRRAFAGAYERTGESRFFDLYTCRR